VRRKEYAFIHAFSICRMEGSRSSVLSDIHIVISSNQNCLFRLSLAKKGASLPIQRDNIFGR
jgi:hypothetical protein